MSVVCTSEFGCVDWSFICYVLHLFAFCMPWRGVLFIVCLRMCCVFVVCVAGSALWILPACGSGNACVVCMLVRSVYVCEGVGTGPERVCPCAVCARCVRVGVSGVGGVRRPGLRGSE